MLATFFYIGEFPVAPGTLASFVGLLICIIVHPFVGMYIIFFIAITVTGFIVCGKTEKLLKRKDASCIVIDEVAGIMIALFLLPLTPAVLITAFFLFRAFDMFKLYPINRMEQWEGSLGVMADDLLAGIYTNVTMHIAIRWAGII